MNSWGPKVHKPGWCLCSCLALRGGNTGQFTVPAQEFTYRPPRADTLLNLDLHAILIIIVTLVSLQRISIYECFIIIIGVTWTWGEGGLSLRKRGGRGGGGKDITLNLVSALKKEAITADDIIPGLQHGVCVCAYGILHGSLCMHDSPGKSRHVYTCMRRCMMAEERGLNLEEHVMCSQIGQDT